MSRPSIAELQHRYRNVHLGRAIPPRWVTRARRIKRRVLVRAEARHGPYLDKFDRELREITDWEQRAIDLEQERSEKYRLGAQLYGLLDAFGQREFTCRDWVERGCYLGKDPSRAWRLLLAQLRALAVPHEVEPTVDGCNALRLSHGTWCWATREAGLVCVDCGRLFRPSKEQVGLAWDGNAVRCGECGA